MVFLMLLVCLLLLRKRQTKLKIEIDLLANLQGGWQCDLLATFSIDSSIVRGFW